MIKLFTLRKLSAFSSDAVYKICLDLERFGLKEEEAEIFENYDELYDEVVLATGRGEHIIVAADNSDYNVVKRDLTGKLLLDGYPAPEIAEFIEHNAGDDASEIDVTGHALVPRGSVFHLSTDGLYSGFTSEALDGRVTCIPLDFMRIDAILESLKQDVLIPLAAVENGEAPPVKMPDFDFVPYISRVVTSLGEIEKTMALATSEATMWIYNLYDKVENFNDVLRFVEVIDGDENEQTTAESESVRIIRHAKEAMTNSGSDFGGAISEIYSTENDEGQTVYFAYAAVVDKSNAKAKKINTMNKDDLAAILPHAVTVLADLVVKKSAAVKKELEADTEAEVKAPVKAEEPKKMSRNMLIFASVILAIAIISPIALVISFFGGKDEPTTAPLTPGGYLSTNPGYNVSTDVFGTTQPISTVPMNPFVTTNSNQISNFATEPSAPDVSAQVTTPPVASSSGTFTFYVFGYGHGVGMSQKGANYLAQKGWSWAEILAHYYYNGNTKIITGDAYPAAINYAGSSYATRDFLASALEAEMGTAAHREALKAQVVALYTFAKYYSFNLNKDSCAILGSGKVPAESSYSVVDEVMALAPYIEYNGTTALTPFHSMSAGLTTAYYNVWGREYSADLPYLSGARKSYGDYLESEYASTYTISSAEMKNLIKNNAQIDVAGDPATWITVLSHDSAIDSTIGYVSTVNVGGTIMTGNDFRIKIMEGRIRSHCFKMVYTPAVS